MLRRLVISLVGTDKDSHISGDFGHVISGPLGQSSNLNAKKKRNPSVLVVAFQNAWKQGNLTAEVSSWASLGPQASYCVKGLGVATYVS